MNPQQYRHGASWENLLLSPVEVFPASGTSSLSRIKYVEEQQEFLHEL